MRAQHDDRAGDGRRRLQKCGTIGRDPALAPDRGIERDGGGTSEKWFRRFSVRVNAPQNTGQASASPLFPLPRSVPLDSPVDHQPQRRDQRVNPDRQSRIDKC